ncbi:LamG-like jellyroll fold domain-containing protein [Nonomuraea sp. 3-1Str]|uniref:LamG domain-containing protein n=1 Tax=Nonomuraea sp. 3-1Str TaxID=2929801 RepID=UPI0037C80BD7
MEGRPFYEPTRELSFIRNLTGGRFAALLVPTAISTMWRWQLFAHNGATGRVDCFNIEQGADGGFNTQGTRFYTSPDAKYRDSVFERAPGKCPFTSQDLVPVAGVAGHAETALLLDGTAGHVDLGSPGALQFGPGAYTIEAWIKPAAFGGTVLAKGAACSLGIGANGTVVLAHNSGAWSVVSTESISLNDYTHVAGVYDGTKASVLVNGRVSQSANLQHQADATAPVLIGAATTAGQPGGFFNGEIDEVRLWERARTAEELKRELGHRLIGNEPGLVAYYRFDEGSGTTAFDQSDRALNGTLRGGVQWVGSQAPVGDHPGVRRDSFSVTGRSVVSGLAAVIYHQQQSSTVGYGTAAKPAKRQARVLLAFATKAPADKDGQVATVDFGVGRDGRLTQVPDVLDMPVLDRPKQSQDLDAISVLEQRIKALETEVRDLPLEIDRLSKVAVNLAGLQDSHDKKVAEVAHYQRIVDRDKGTMSAWLWRLEMKGSPGRPTISIRGDSLESQAELVRNADPNSPSGQWRFIWTDASASGPRRYVIMNALSYRSIAPAGSSADDMTRLVQARPGAVYIVEQNGEYVRLIGTGNGLAISSAGTGSTVVHSRAALTNDTGLIKMVPARHIGDFDTSLKKAQTELVSLRISLDEARNAQTRLAALQLTLAAKTTELDTARNQLARMTGAAQGATDLTVTMPLLALDRTGLSCAGAVLSFARCADAPVLMDSATGHVVLYFRGVNDQFFAAYFDTFVIPSTQELPVDSNAVVFTARDACIDLGALTITVSDGDAPGRCDLTISGGKEGETWRSLPRNAERMTAILAGVPGEPVRLTTVATVNRTQVELAEPLTTAVPKAAHLTIGSNGYSAGADHPVGAKTLTLAAAGQPITVGAVVTLVGYDYQRATCARPGVPLTAGSRLVGLAAGTVASIANGAAKRLVSGHGCRWRGEMPGRAYSFDGRQQHLRLPAAQLERVTVTGDLTMETWAHVAPVSGKARIVHANSGQSPYTMALVDAPLKTAKLFNGSESLELSKTIELAERDFSIELWARRDAGQTHTQPLLLQGDPTGRQNRTLHLQIFNDNSFGFSLWGDDLVAPGPPDVGWHHWAVTHEHATRAQVIYLDGVEVARRTANAAYVGRGPLLLGFKPFAGQYLSGAIDEVRVFGRVRTPAEINGERNQRLSGREPNLLGYWTFPGPSALPSPIKGYQLVAGVGGRFVRSQETFPCGEWTHLAAAFQQSWAVKLDGGAYLEVGKEEALNVTEDLTIEVFLQADRLGSTMGLVSKGELGLSGGVPYQLSVRGDGKLEFAFEEPGGNVVRYTSTAGITPRAFQRVAVVRKRRKVEVSATSQTPPDTDPGKDIRFYINGQPVGADHYTGPGAQANSSNLTMGRIGSGAAFSGVLGEVRLWSVAREPAQIGLPVAGRDRGLLARWAFEENTGNVTLTSDGSYPARLRSTQWVRDPDPIASPFRLYRNGVPVVAVSTPDPGPADYGDQQLTLGARLAGGAVSEPFSGMLEEIRIWRTARTTEQVLDNLFTRLKGDKQDLVAYWPFDRDSTAITATQVHDEGLRGNDLEFPAARPRPMLSSAPIATDTAQVRSALAAIRTPFHDTIGAAPAVAEYADMQHTAKGEPFGVLKRCYSFVRQGRWHLVTGYKVGNLVSEWVGQAQFDPQLIGYIESAPPVPSENLTGADSFAGASSVEFTEADQVTYSMSSSRTSSIDSSFEVKIGQDQNQNLLMISAPMGVGTAKPIVEVDYKLTGVRKLEFSNAWSDETKLSQGLNTTRAAKLRLTGNLEDPTQLLNPAIGRRYVPANTGFALVQSETADIFALRLAHTGALVAYRMMPNPDIPRDWNIIAFPVNPRYTKQGTLDGAVGFDDRGKVRDPDYPAAADYGQHSFFKPQEAYALKRRIVRDQQRLRAYYESISTKTHTPDQTQVQAGKILRNMGMTAEVSSGDRNGSSSSAPEKFSHRDLVNTYVWTAQGGFFAETTQATDSVTQTHSGSYTFKAADTGTVEFKITIVGFGLTGHIEASLAGSTSVTRTRAKDVSRSFGLTVDCAPSGDLQRYDSGKPVFTAQGKPVLVPGKVDAYRFLTFYLGESSANFDDFFHKVVDPVWLANSGAADAAALRQARQTAAKPPCWRIMHRVTFISRVLPPIPPPGAPPLERAMRVENISSNYELIQRLAPYTRTATASKAVLATATRAALTTHLPELVPHAAEVIDYLADYYGIDN